MLGSPLTNCGLLKGSMTDKIVFCSNPMLWKYYSAGSRFSHVFILTLFTIMFFGCENDIGTIKLITDKKNLPVSSGKNMVIMYSDSAREKVKIVTPELNRYVMQNNPYTELPKGLHADFFNEKHDVTSTLTAKYAIRYEKEQKMVAKNDVVVINAKGEQLNTEYLVWDEKTSKISSNEFVRITTASESITGVGFEANQDFSWYKIFNIKGNFKVNKDANAKNP